MAPPVASPAGEHAMTDDAAVIALSFVVCVSDEAILKANVCARPVCDQGYRHEFIGGQELPQRGRRPEPGLERARHEWVVCVHQDVFLPEGWDRCLARQLREAERRFGPIGVAGVYGVGEVIALADSQETARRRTHRLGRRSRPRAPRRARAARPGRDPRRAAAGRAARCGPAIRPALGFHLYGADICLQAREKGLAVVAVGALVPPQLAEHRAAGGVLSECEGASPANGGTGCRSPRRASSSAARPSSYPGQYRARAPIDRIHLGGADEKLALMDLSIPASFVA